MRTFYAFIAKHYLVGVPEVEPEISIHVWDDQPNTGRLLDLPVPTALAYFQRLIDAETLGLDIDAVEEHQLWELLRTALRQIDENE